MSTITTTAPTPTRVTRLAAWLGRNQSDLSTRVHAAGDARMTQAGLTVTTGTGRLGFGSRTYRHPGFSSR